MPVPTSVQALEKQAIEQEAKLIAFDRQNHMGASEKGATSLQNAILQVHDAKG